MRYSSLSSLIPSVSKTLQDAVNLTLENYLKQSPPNPRVFMLTKDVPIEKLRDDAMIYLLEHS